MKYFLLLRLDPAGNQCVKQRLGFCELGLPIGLQPSSGKALRLNKLTEYHPSINKELLDIFESFRIEPRSGKRFSCVLLAFTWAIS